MSSRILKILSGPNCGAEAELVPGRYVLGSDSGCDIVLADSAIAPNHLALEIKQNGQETLTRAVPLEGQSLLKNERIEANGAQVEDFALLTLGGTYIILGPADQLWPALSLPDLVQSGTATIQPEKEALETEKENEVEAGVEKTEEKETVAEEKNETGPVRVPRQKVFFLLALLLVISGAVLWWTLFPSVSDQEKMQAILKQGNFREVRLQADEKENLTLSGYVLKNTDLERLRQIVQQIPARVNVSVLSDAVKTLHQKLAEQDIALKVQQTGYTVSVHGYLEDSKSREELTVLVRETLPPGLKVKYNLMNWQDMAELLQQPLTARGLGKKLFFTPSGNKILVRGNLNQEELALWQGITEEIADRIGGGSPFSRVQITGGATPVSQFQIQKTVKKEMRCADLQLVKTAGRYYIELQQKKYAPGDVLPDGYRVKELTDARIVLSGPGQMLYCPVTSPKESQ